MGEMRSATYRCMPPMESNGDSLFLRMHVGLVPGIEIMSAWWSFDLLDLEVHDAPVSETTNGAIYSGVW